MPDMQENLQGGELSSLSSQEAGENAMLQQAMRSGEKAQSQQGQEMGNGAGQEDQSSDITTTIDSLVTPRPRGLVPGTSEWLKEIEGPRLIKRVAEEVHANPVGEMTPTQARCASMLIPLIYPALSAVHHTVETTHSKASTEDLEKRFAQLMEAHKLHLHMDGREAVTVEYTEESKEENHDRM